MERLYLSEMAFGGFVFRVSRLHVQGLALFPFVFIKGEPTPVLLNHEKIHLRQQLELGLLLFYLWYAVEYLLRYLRYRDHWRAYFSISFEKEAFENETDFKYLSERKVFAFFRYL